MKDKLREILYTVPDIKKDLEELKIGCEVKGQYWICKVIWFEESKQGSDSEDITLTDEFIYSDSIQPWTTVDEVIWNPLEEKYFYMYSEEVWIDIIDTFKVIYDNFDYTKTIDTQSQDFYKTLYKHLTQ